MHRSAYNEAIQRLIIYMVLPRLVLQAATMPLKSSDDSLIGNLPTRFHIQSNSFRQTCKHKHRQGSNKVIDHDKYYMTSAADVMSANDSTHGK